MSLQLIETFTHTSQSGSYDVAKVYKDTEWNEYRVKYFKDGRHLENADSHHDDREDAETTAKWQVERLVG